jgi:hypothetical protein
MSIELENNPDLAGSTQLTEQLIQIGNIEHLDSMTKEKEAMIREKITDQVLSDNPWKKRRPTVSPVKEMPTNLEDSFEEKEKVREQVEKQVRQEYDQKVQLEVKERLKGFELFQKENKELKNQIA